MKFEREVLLDALKSMRAVVGGAKTPKNVLSCANITPHKGGALVTVTDFDTVRTRVIPGTVAKTERAFLPVVKLLDGLKRLTSDEVVITGSESATLFECGTLKLNLTHGFKASDWPEFPADLAAGPSTTVPAGLLGTALGRVDYARSTDETRPSINCIYFEPVVDGQLGVVATDGHRLAYASFKAPTALKGGWLLTPSSVAELGRRLAKPAAPKVKITEGPKWVTFTIGDDAVSCRRSDETFPDWRKVKPKVQHSLTVGRDDFAHVVDRLLPWVSPVTGIAKFTPALTGKGKCLHVNVNNAEFGDATDTLPVAAFTKTTAKGVGDVGPIGFNLRYLEAALKHLTSPAVKVGISNQFTPMVLDDTDQFHVIMPMRV